MGLYLGLNVSVICPGLDGPPISAYFLRVGFETHGDMSFSCRFKLYSGRNIFCGYAGMTENIPVHRLATKSGSAYNLTRVYWGCLFAPF